MSDEARQILQGFLDAEYGFDVISVPPLQIGGTAEGCGRRHWITAFNPLGVRQPEAGNEDAQRSLQTALSDHGYRWEHGFARSRASAPEHWHEPCAVVVDARHEHVDALALRFRQLATVAQEPGVPARLRCYRSQWRERFGVSDMDAPNVDWVA